MAQTRTPRRPNTRVICDGQERGASYSATPGHWRRSGMIGGDRVARSSRRPFDCNRSGHGTRSPALSTRTENLLWQPRGRATMSRDAKSRERPPRPPRALHGAVARNRQAVCTETRWGHSCLELGDDEFRRWESDDWRASRWRCKVLVTDCTRRLRRMERAMPRPAICALVLGELRPSIPNVNAPAQRVRSHRRFRGGERRRALKRCEVQP